MRHHKSKIYQDSATDVMGILEYSEKLPNFGL